MKRFAKITLERTFAALFFAFLMTTVPVPWAFADEGVASDDATHAVAEIEEESGDIIYTPELTALEDDAPTASASISTGYTDAIVGDFYIVVSDVVANFDVSQVRVSVRQADKTSLVWYGALMEEGVYTAYVPLSDWEYAAGLYIIQVHVCGAEGQDVVVQTRGKNVTNTLSGEFQVISDLQIDGDNTEKTDCFEDTLRQIASRRTDGIVINGDLVENSRQAEYDVMWKCIDRSGLSHSLFTLSAGNHEFRTQWGENYTVLRYRFLHNVGRDSVYYETTVAGQPCLVLGTDVEPWSGCVAGHYSDEEIAWLKQRLDYYTAQQRVVFVFTHHPLVNTINGSYPWQWAGHWPNFLENSDEVKAVVDSYNNAVVFSSHTHYKLWLANVYNQDMLHPVYLNTAAIAYQEDEAGAILDGIDGWYVFEFEDRIVLRAYDFYNEEWTPYIYTYPRSRILFQDVAVAEAGDGAVTLAWEPVDGTGCYVVTVYDSSGAALYTVDCDGTETSYQVTGLENGVRYGFSVCALPKDSWLRESGVPAVYATPRNVDPYAPRNLDTIPVIRLYAGGNRFETSAMISRDNVAAFDGAGTHATGIIVVTGNNFPDALSAAGLSGTTGYPVVMVNGKGLVEADHVALDAYSAAADAPLDILIIGSDDAISASVEEELAAYGVVGENGRICGENRYETNLAVCAYGEGWKSERTFLATGANFPDALSIAPYLAATGCRLVLVDSNEELLSDEQMALLAGDVIALGSEVSVPETMLQQVADAGHATERLYGQNRYETAAEIVIWELASEQGMNLEGCGIATGQNFPDALSSSSLLASSDSVMCLMSPNTADNALMCDVLSENAELAGITYLRVFGSAASVPVAVREQVREALSA